MIGAKPAVKETRMSAAPMILHWSPRSPYVRKVMITAHEPGLADRLQIVRTVVGGAEPHRALMTQNPLGKIPTLVLEDGTVIFDSPVICEYLDTLHDGPKLFPRWPERLTTLRRLALGDGMLDIALAWLSERLRPRERQSALHIELWRGENSRLRRCAGERGRSACGSGVLDRPYRRSVSRSGISISVSRRLHGGRIARGWRDGRRRSISAHRCGPTCRWTTAEAFARVAVSVPSAAPARR